MKKIFTLILLLAITTFGTLSAEAATKVRSYYKSNGTYVGSHYRSNSDSRKSNNYSSKGNYNPYTGKKGYKNW